MDNSQSHWQSTYKRWLRWFIIPNRVPQNLIEQQQAKQLTFYLFLLASGAFFNFIMWLLLGDLTTFTILGMLASLGLYLSARFFHYKMVAIAAIISALIFPFILFLFSPIDLTLVAIIFLVSIALLISSQFLSFRSNLQLSILAIIITFILNRVAAPDNTISLGTILIPVLLIVSLMNLNAYGRERLAFHTRRNENPRDPIFFSNALQMLPDAAIIQVDKIIIDVNKAAVRLIGAERDMLIGQEVTQFISTGSSSNYILDKEADHLTIRYDDFLHLAQQKGSRAVSVTARSISYAEQLATLMILRPNEIDRENQVLHQMLDVSSTAMMLTDVDMTIMMVNPALCDLSQYQLSELRGQSIRLLFDEHTEEVQRLLAQNHPNGTEQVRIQTMNYAKDGSRNLYTWAIKPIQDSNDTVSHYIFSAEESKTQGNLLKEILDERESTFREISDLMSDYAYALAVDDDASTRFVWVTGDFYNKTGLSQSEIMRLHDWQTLIHEGDVAFYALRTKALLRGETRSLEYRIVHKNGTIRWIQDTAHPIYDEKTGEVSRILGAANDISERIQAQETLKTHVVQQAVVAELGLLALNTNDHTQITQHVAVLCEQVLSIGFVAVFEHRAADNKLVCVNLSRPDMPIRIGDGIDDHYLSSLAAYTLQSQEAVISEDLADEPRFKPLPQILEMQYGSAVGIVVMGNNNTPYGVLTVYSKFTHDFTHDEIYFLQAVANVLGTFIERNRAQEAEREQAEFAEALRNATGVINSRLELPEVLAQIMSFLRQVVPKTQQASIMLRDEETGLYHNYLTSGFADDKTETDTSYVFSLEDFPILQYMVDTGEAVHISNTSEDSRWVNTKYTPKVSSYLGAPIIVDAETIGFINLDAYVPDAFSAVDKARLKTFAETASTAIVNAQKQEDLERKVIQRTAELKQQSKQIETILAGTGDGIFYTENSRIVFANNALCQMMGYSIEELRGKPTAIFRPSDAPANVYQLQAVLETSRSGEILRDTLRLQRKDGTIFDAGLTISLIESSDQEMLRAVTVVRDISKERELEELKKTFIAAAAHDLRSPISSLQMRMHMIKRQPEQMDYHMERLNAIIERINRLVNDLLDAHGRIVLRPQNVILQDILDLVVDILAAEAEEKGIRFNYESPTEPISILADKHRLEQVFYNLITNAINYTDAGGQITVAYRVNLEARIIELDIQDSGVGIASEELENIFLPFYRTKDNERKGNGLGLSITREIVILHGGEIHVASVLGKGSTFTISLPLLETE